MKNKKLLLNFNLQHFADAEPGTEPGTEPGAEPGQAPGEPGEPGADDPQKFTQEQLDEILKKRLEKERNKWQKQVEQDKAEAERLAKLSADERQKEQFKAQMAAFEAEKQAFEAEKLKLQAGKLLQERGISIDLVEFVAKGTAEETLENINTLDKAFKAAVKAEVDTRLKTAPPKGDNPGSQQMTKEEFKKLSLAQQSKIYNDDPTLYAAMTKN